MTNPQFIEEEPLSLASTKEVLDSIAKRDEEMGYLSKKVHEYLADFAPEKNTLTKALVDLDLTRLKAEHIAKIVDFKPKDVDDLKIVLQAYPLSLPKKDQDAIIKAVASSN